MTAAIVFHRISSRLLLAPLLAVALVAGCGGRWHAPIRSVDGTRYFVAEGRAPITGVPDFDRHVAFLSGASALARSLSTEVDSRLTADQRARLETLLRGGSAQRALTGTLQFVDEAKAHSTLREIHELRLREEGRYLVLNLGIPVDTWRQLVEEAAAQTDALLRAGAELEATPARPMP